MGGSLWLKKPSDFKRVFKGGKRFTSPHFVLYVCKSPFPSGVRLGVSILKSHVKLATRRNRLRRVAKELFRKGLAENFSGYDFAIRSRSKNLGGKVDNVSVELKELYEKFVDLCN